MEDLSYLPQQQNYIHTTRVLALKLNSTFISFSLSGLSRYAHFYSFRSVRFHFIAKSGIWYSCTASSVLYR